MPKLIKAKESMATAGYTKGYDEGYAEMEGLYKQLQLNAKRKAERWLRPPSNEWSWNG